MFSIRYLLVQPYWSDYPDKLCNNFHYVPGIVILAGSYSKRYQWLNSFSIIFNGWIWHDGKVLIFIPETNYFQKVIEEMKFQEVTFFPYVSRTMVTRGWHKQNETICWPLKKILLFWIGFYWKKKFRFPLIPYLWTWTRYLDLFTLSYLHYYPMHNIVFANLPTNPDYLLIFVFADWTYHCWWLVENGRSSTNCSHFQRTPANIAFYSEGANQ